jgi:hypothetical protein
MYICIHIAHGCSLSQVKFKQNVFSKLLDEKDEEDNDDEQQNY